MTIQTPAQAQADVTKLETRKDALERQIEKVLAEAARQYAGAADGAPIESDELIRLQAELRIVDAMLGAASDALKVAERIEAARAPLKRFDEAKKRLAYHAEVAGEVSQLLNSAAIRLQELVANGVTLQSALRFGRDATGPQGVTVFDRSLLTPQHLQFCVENHLARRVTGWRTDLHNTHGAATFGEQIREACGALANELELFVGTADLLPEDVTAIRAEQRAQGVTQEPERDDGQAAQELAALEAYITSSADDMQTH